MSDVDLSGYEITFRKDRLFGWWTWSVKTPDGVKLRPVVASASLQKEHAEQQALRAITADASMEIIDGNALAERLGRAGD